MSPDGKCLVTSRIGAPFQVLLWDVHRDAEGPRLVKRLPPLESHNGPVFGVAFSPDGRLFATAGVDGKVIVWDAATSQKTLPPLERTASRLRAWSVAFHPRDGRHLAVGYSASQVLIWDRADPAKEPTVLTGHTGDVFSVAYSPDGRWLASASWHEVIIWDPAARKEVRRLGGYPGLIWCVAWSPDSRRLAVANGRKGVGEIELCDVTDLTEKAAAAEPGP